MPPSMQRSDRSSVFRYSTDVIDQVRIVKPFADLRRPAEQPRAVLSVPAI